ncbi:hypothetical protein FHX44_112541 [Pseudonocardia hierapolitana]|uniref:Uncharacterized protein n=1 Tax=Pseudonocardia hierapolitana TaxID=1128676 RepID=A0A561SP58_9PSEU|nr:hypothetical protein [Pseudonocardia hierapolitana]TWF76646.1 hypothetical protein FHX44_112541 [Pseudonocardia hierapolitana]
MQEQFDAGLKAHVIRDQDNRLRAIRHSQEYWESDEGSPLAAAIAYLRAMASAYEVPGGELDNLPVRATHLDPRTQGIEYRLAEERTSFDSTTFSFAQTVLNTPVWAAGLKVTVKQGPNRVVRSVNTAHAGIEVEMPPEESVERYRRLFQRTEILRARRAAGDELSEDAEDEGRDLLIDLTDAEWPSERAAVARRQTRLIFGQFWVYQYDELARVPSSNSIPERFNRDVGRESGETGEVPDDRGPLLLPLPPVDERIQDGAYYLVAEITFEMPVGDREQLTWRMLVEVQTNSVLYLRALVSEVDGQLFLQDPPTKTGNSALNAASNNATLNPHRDTVLLQNLNAPSGGTQSLSGTFGRLQEVEGDMVAAPASPTGTDFLYDVRTNNFAAVSAYFHVDRIFREIAGLGWTIAGGSGYFSNTSFPVSIDHRCFSGNVINAHCVGDGLGGIGHVGYGIMDLTDTGNVLGRACDPRVHWHELCGHGILYEAVGTANFGFAHSAGDSLSGIYFDPDSNLRGVDGTPLGKPGDLRFTYVPWHPTLNRRFDRDVAAGWAWGGAQDDAGYGSEEILATTLFRVYRSIGGDSADVGRRRFASRMMLYLILRAVQNLTPASNPSYARDFCAELMATDQLNWTSEGIFGGAYNKVFRWSFEKQGEFQSPLITNGGPGDGTIVAPGQPPDQDVYIDDGRVGEYQYQPVHWHTTTIWNRRSADGMTTHEEPALGETNYAYVKVKNRGTQTATNVIVRGFHTRPGAGLLWPGDFETFSTAQIAVGTIAGNNTQEEVVGPFEWTPNINAYGHDCMLMVVSADGDASNVDNFTVGEVIPEWRLVPNDNNVGQRNVQPVAGGGGGEGLLQSLDGVSVWVGNPNPRRALMTLHAELPQLLASAGWRLSFEGLDDDRFILRPGARREVVLRLKAGQDFTKDAVAAAGICEIRVTVRGDGDLLGGMTYRLDPELTRPYNARPGAKRDCRRPAKELLDCLGIHDQDLKDVKVKEVIVGFKMRDDDC